MNVVLYGANGWTGVLTAKMLEALGLPFVLAGRNEAKLAATSARLASRPRVHVAALADRAALERAFRGANVVVNCAGPYIQAGPPVIEAALAAGCHYLDSSGENSYVRSVFEKYDAPARAAGVTIAPAFGPKGAFGDWAAAVAAAPFSSIDEIAIAYALGVREYFQPTATSVLAIAAQGLFKTKDDYDPKRPISRSFEFPPPFSAGIGLLAPTTDDVTIPRHVPVHVVRTFVALAPGDPANALWARFCETFVQGVPAFSYALWSNPALIRAIFREPYNRMTTDSFAVVAEVTGSNGVQRLAVTLRDAYAITSDVLVYGVKRLAAGDAPRGVVAPSVLCDPRRALKDFIASGLVRVKRARS